MTINNADTRFSPGVSIDSPPTGDVEREAVASLRGYAYQVAAASIAWLELDATGKLYLEVAEDYAVVAAQSLEGVQVKDTAASGSLTLNNESVRQAIAAFVGLVAKNQDRDVRLRFLCTSEIGTEKQASDRPGGEAGLEYWRRAAAGADVEPLRAILTSDKFPEEVRRFVAAREPAALRADLLQKIHWDCGKPDLAGIVQEIEERLIVLGRDRFKLPAAESKRLADVSMYHVLKKSVLKSAADRVLTRAELYRVIEAATQLTVPRQAVAAMLGIGSALVASFGGAEQSEATFSVTDTSWLIPSTELATPRAVISRESLASQIKMLMAKHGHVVITGGSGLGKSILAREVASKTHDFVTLDLRDASALETAERLRLVLGNIGALQFNCLIFDDCNQIEDPKSRVALARCLKALQRRDRCAIITAYSRPSQKTLTDLGLDPEAVIETPYLTQEEANEVVRAAGGDAEGWGRKAFASGAQGHPQLVHAFVLGMAARGWPASEMQEVMVRGFSSDDIEAERKAVRSNMVTALSESARDVLYRLSLVMGRLDRGLAIAIAEVPPPIGRAGELLDGLIGPWIEVVGRDALRVSPLAANAGQGMLSAEAQRTIHAAIAVQMLSKQRIHAADADSILMHGLRGEEARSLFRLSYAILTAEPEAIELLQDHLFILPILRTDQPIFRTNSVVSLMLRLAQFKMVAAKQDDEQTAATAAALLREAAEGETDRRELFEGLALGSILNTIGIASSVPNWVELLRRFQGAVNSNSIMQGFKEAAEKAVEIAPTFGGVLFRLGSTQLRSVERLEEIFADLDNLTDNERSSWLEGFEKASECSLLVNPPWTAEQRRNQLNPEDAANRYERMANLAQKWKYRALSIQCHIARAVMFDEYLNAKDRALGALHAAVGHFGEDVEISRARARIFWRNGNYEDAVAIMRGIADVVGADNPIERAYALRQAAISAAKMGEWAEAADWFKDAETAAASSDLDDMKTMAVGLEADRAVALLNNGDAAGALDSMASCLTRLAEINSDGSLRAAYCHRVVRHTVLWMDAEIDKRERQIDGKNIEMLPGACSNPEPPASITELPLAPLDAGWYMLAQAEISSGCDVGIERSLHSRLKDGPILIMETELRTRRLTMDIRDVDSAGFAGHLLDYLSAMQYLHVHHRALGDSFNPLTPPRGEIQTLATTELTQPFIAEVAEDAVLAFGMSAAFRGVGNRFADLRRCLVEAFGPNIPGKSTVDRWDGTDGAANDPILMIYSGEHMEPRTVWWVGLRLFQRIRQSALRTVLAPALKDWMLREWRRITTEETFRLSYPMQTVPTIEACLSESKKSEALIASILLRSIDAVGVVLSADIEQQLKEAASGDR